MLAKNQVNELPSKENQESSTLKEILKRMRMDLRNRILILKKGNGIGTMGCVSLNASILSYLAS